LTGAALVGAFVIGVWIGPRVMHRNDVNAFPAGWVPGASPEETAAVLTTKPRPIAAKTTDARPAKAVRVAFTEAEPAVAVPASAQSLQRKLQPLLNRGANMQIASEGFRDGEQFAASVHASRNADIPFMVLKHHVVDDGQTLAQAIRSTKPGVDATAEAKRAHQEARSDLE
jgi:hypothetical protein